MKIYHHPRPYHFDDFLAVSLLKDKYPHAELREVRVRSVDEIEDLEEGDIVVDVGMKYDPNRKFYDHHHDINTPSSLILVLKHEFPELYERAMKVDSIRKLLEYIDLRDRFGPAKAAEMLGLDRTTADLVARLAMLMMDEPNQMVGQSLVNLINSYSRVADNVKTYKIGDYTIAYTTADPRTVPPSIVFEVTNADILIAPNTRNPNQTSIIKNTNKPETTNIDLSRLKDRYNITFMHRAGFMAVIDETPANVSPFDVAETLGVYPAHERHENYESPEKYNYE